jgi:hypothetical protein
MRDSYTNLIYLLKISKEITDNQELIRSSLWRIPGSKKAEAVESPEANIFMLVGSYVHTLLKK